MAGPRLYCSCDAARQHPGELLPMEPVCDFDAAGAGFIDRAEDLAGRMADSQAQAYVRASLAARGVSAANPTARWYALRRDRKPRGRQPNTPVRVTCLADWAPQADMPF